MSIYVESNFVLELALMQEQHESCENILLICEAGNARLVLPAFSIAEPYETLVRRHKSRIQLRNDLTTELKQISRSKPYSNEIEALQNVTVLLIRSVEEEKQRLYQTRDRILNVAEIIPLSAEILISAAKFQTTLALSPQDSIVYASVLHHLNTSEAVKKCFLNRNSKDFDDPDIVQSLENYGCKMLFSFASGYNYIQSHINPTSAGA